MEQNNVSVAKIPFTYKTIKDYIMSQTMMLECFKVRVDTKSEECYKLFCCMNTFDEHESFNLRFQVMLTKICILYEKVLLQVVLQEK